MALNESVSQSTTIETDRMKYHEAVTSSFFVPGVNIHIDPRGNEWNIIETLSNTYLGVNSNHQLVGENLSQQHISEKCALFGKYTRTQQPIQCYTITYKSPNGPDFLLSVDPNEQLVLEPMPNHSVNFRGISNNTWNVDRDKYLFVRHVQPGGSMLGRIESVRFQGLYLVYDGDTHTAGFSRHISTRMNTSQFFHIYNCGQPTNSSILKAIRKAKANSYRHLSETKPRFTFCFPRAKNRTLPEDCDSCDNM